MLRGKRTGNGISKIRGIREQGSCSSAIIDVGTDGPFHRWTDPAKSAYDSAIEVLQNEPGLDDSYLIWMRDKTSMANVQDALEKAVKEYENKAEDSKVRQWLASCSSRVLYYGSQFVPSCIS